MCMLCAHNQGPASLAQMLRLVTLLEHPDALLPERALNLGHRTLHELPLQHAPDFAPVIEPNVRTGVTATLAAAFAWLCRSERA